ncbi:MAG: hypothetical protein KGD64_01300 [Candidatus Heimdallarchaeota archaeon]|nr:hypothetical protein [Candidatus Heimdallarchaeota archaeon]
MSEIKHRQNINRREERNCEECGKDSLLIDEIRGEIICGNCGTVKKED